jgi:hypothetical protein
MPEIAIKQTLNDAQFKRGLAENAGNIRNWGKEAERVFESTRTAADRFAQELAKLDRVKGMVGLETYTRALDQLGQKFAAAENQVARSTPFKGPIPGTAGARGEGAEAIAGQLGGMLGPVGGAALGAIFNPITAGIATFAALGTAIHGTAEEMRGVVITAEKLGISLHALEGLTILGGRTGIGAEQFGRAIEGLEKKIGMAAVEGGKPAEALRSLNINPEDLSSKTPEEAFVRVAEAISSISNKFERARIEAELFGRGGMEMDMMLKHVATDFAEAMKEAPIEKLAAAAGRMGESFHDAGVKAHTVWTSFVGLLQVGVEKTERNLGLIGRDVELVGATPEVAARMAKHEEDQARAAKAAEVATKTIEKQNEEAQKLGDAWREAASGADKYQIAIDKFPKGSDARAFLELDAARAREAEQSGKEDAYAKRINEMYNTQGMGEYGKMRYEATNLIADVEKRAAVIAKINEMERDADRMAGDAAKNRLGLAGDRMRESLQDEEARRGGRSSREIQLQHMAEQGLDPKKAEALAGLIAKLDADDAVRSRKDTLAPNLAQGSREAYDVLARAQSPQADKQAQLVAETNRRLDVIRDWLQKLYSKQAAVAPAP